MSEKQDYSKIQSAANEREARKQIALQKVAKKKKKNKGTIIVICILIVLALTGFSVYKLVLIPKSHYDQGLSLQKAGKWQEAIDEFEQCISYSDARTQILATHYAEGKEKLSLREWDDAVLAFSLANEYSDARTQILATHYAEGEEKLSLREWDDAVLAFSLANEYSDARTQILATHYAEGEEKLSLREWDDAVLAFSLANEYSDAKQQISEAYYLKAKSLYDSGNYSEAYTLYKTIRDYKDVSSIIQGDVNIISVRQTIKDTYKRKGNCVLFGHFEQDNNSSNGKEEIEWIVLSTRGNKVLLISKYVLGAVNNDSSISMDVYRYENSPVRRWLNGSFYNSAFNDNEKSAIIEATVDNSSSQSNTYTVKYGSSKYATKYTHQYSSGENTSDKVFILSFMEAWNYFSSNDDRMCQPTLYAIAQGAEEGYKGATDWWLRSTGDEKYHIAFVSEYGSDSSTYAYPGTKGVRPVLWLDLDASFDIY